MLLKLTPGFDLPHECSGNKCETSFQLGDDVTVFLSFSLVASLNPYPNELNEIIHFWDYFFSCSKMLDDKTLQNWKISVKALMK